MKIITFENLSDKLSQDLVWRKKELGSLKSIVNGNADNLTKSKLLSRCGVAILYAHWEGYIKKASGTYLEFVSLKTLKKNELADNFLAILLRKISEKNGKLLNFANYLNIVNFFRNNSEGKSRVFHSGMISTKSNLSYEIFEEITTLLGVDISFFESKKQLINNKLLGKRNVIAHGEYSVIESNDYLELHDNVIEMMNSFKAQLENLACQKKYRKIGTSSFFKN